MSYYTETYPVSIDVRVTFHSDVLGTDTFEDAHKGETVEHALERAAVNWPGATIEFLRITEADDFTIGDCDGCGTTGPLMLAADRKAWQCRTCLPVDERHKLHQAHRAGQLT